MFVSARGPRRVGLVAAGLLLCSSAAIAQTGQTAQIPLQFDFLNPGARSLGLGSAFVAVADDATSAFTNPAGLTFAVRPFEVSAEGRYRSLTTPYLSSGRLSGTPTGEGLDTVAGPRYGASVDSAVRPYFLSVVWKWRGWVVAAYRHELVQQTNAFLSQGPFFEANRVFNNSRLFGLTGDRDIRLVTYGASAARQVSPRVAIGEGVSVYRFSLISHFAALDTLGGFFGPADPATAGTLSTTTQSGTGTQIGFNVGVLVTPRRAIRLGLVFRQSASFLEEVNVVPDTPTLTRVGAFRTPGVLGAGVRLQPSEALSIAVDYDWVQYAHLTTDFITFQVDPSVSNHVAISSGSELHVGAEYTFGQALRELAVRGGVWFDPDHAVQYASDGSGSDTDTRMKAVFPGGQGVWHYCVGLGLPLSRSLEVNVGSDFTSQRRYVSASLVARFGHR